jgi:hypothetical protein
LEMIAQGIIIDSGNDNEPKGGIVMAQKVILGVQIGNRVVNVPEVQKVLTQYGCNIKTRLGLHEVDAKACSSTGLLIVETFGPARQIAAFEKALRKIKGLKVRKMVF